MFSQDYDPCSQNGGRWARWHQPRGRVCVTRSSCRGPLGPRISVQRSRGNLSRFFFFFECFLGFTSLAKRARDIFFFFKLEISYGEPLS